MEFFIGCAFLEGVVGDGLRGGPAIQLFVSSTFSGLKHERMSYNCNIPDI